MTGPGGGPRPSPQSPAFVGKVYARVAAPTSTGTYFAVHPATVLGAEDESGPGSMSVDLSSTVLVCVMGGRVPVVGDSLICRFAGDRWVAESLFKAGGGAITIPSCYCNAIPPTLTMSSSDPTSNGGMFQNCTLQFGATPPEYNALSLGSQCFLSTTSFLDPNGESFRYYFGCVYASFNLSRVYAQSSLGSPYQDLVRYTWSLGFAGNTCTPFLLSNGRIYSGGDSRCIVTLSP